MEVVCLEEDSSASASASSSPKHKLKTNSSLEECIASCNHTQFITLATPLIDTKNTSNAAAGDEEVEIIDDGNNKSQKLKEFLSKCLSQINENIKNESKKDHAMISSSDTIYLEYDKVQLIEPRGKFKSSIGAKGILFTGTSHSFYVSWNTISHLILLPLPADTKKKCDSILLYVLNKPTTFNGKSIHKVAWQLSHPPSPLRATYGPVVFSGSEIDVISGLTQALIGKPLIVPDSRFFYTTKQTFFLRCYKGVQEGNLYLLKEGIIFVKPIIFIPAKNVASIAAGRGGQAMTKFIDLKIECEDNTSYEFSNIDRDDLPAIHNYVQYYVRLRKKEDEEKRGSQVSSSGAADESKKLSSTSLLGGDLSSSDDSDDDWDGDSSSSDEGGDDDRSSDDSNGEDGSSDDADSDDAESDDDDRDDHKKKSKSKDVASKKEKSPKAANKKRKPADVETSEKSNKKVTVASSSPSEVISIE